MLADKGKQVCTNFDTGSIGLPMFNLMLDCDEKFCVTFQAHEKFLISLE